MSLVWLSDFNSNHRIANFCYQIGNFDDWATSFGVYVRKIAATQMDHQIVSRLPFGAFSHFPILTKKIHKNIYFIT